MIIENFIEVKPHAKKADPSIVEMLSTRLKTLPGNVAVLCDPFLETTEAGIYLPDGEWRGSQNSDTGTVVASGYKGLKKGDRVAFLPMHGLRCGSKEFDFVPDGWEVRFYGVACPVWESLVLLEED